MLGKYNFAICAGFRRCVVVAGALVALLFESAADAGEPLDPSATKAALARVEVALRVHKLAWPDTFAPRTKSPGNPTSDRFWNNSRTLWFVNDSTGQYGVVVLARSLERAETPHFEYVLAVVTNALVAPVATLNSLPTLMNYKWSDEDGLNCGHPIGKLPDAPAGVSVGPCESDNLFPFAWLPGRGLVAVAVGLSDALGNLERAPDDGDSEPIGIMIKHAYWDKRKELTAAPPFRIFSVPGGGSPEVYAVTASDVTRWAQHEELATRRRGPPVADASASAKEDLELKRRMAQQTPAEEAANRIAVGDACHAIHVSFVAAKECRDAIPATHEALAMFAAGGHTVFKNDWYPPMIEVAKWLSVTTVLEGVCEVWDSTSSRFCSDSCAREFSANASEATAAARNVCSLAVDYRTRVRRVIGSD